jgi:hypothetical protein
MRKSIAIVFIAICLAGCGMADAVVNGMKHSAAVETAIQEATGVKPSVGFNWNNGRLTSVTVTFPQLYDTKPLRDVAEIAREAVVREFEQTPDHILLAFALGSEPIAPAQTTSMH